MSEALEPVWIVNDLGELGVQVAGRFFFLCKGDNLEYGTDDDGSPVALHDDGTPMKYRIVGKREFGECCYPMAWVTQGRREKRYMVDLTFIPGLSWGKPEDGMWRELPVPPPAATQPSTEDDGAGVVQALQLDKHRAHHEAVQAISEKSATQELITRDMVLTLMNRAGAGLHDKVPTHDGLVEIFTDFACLVLSLEREHGITTHESEK